MKTFCFKLYHAKRNKKLHHQINAAGLAYNHCIAIHKKFYKLYGKSLNKYVLQKHLTKLKKLPKYSYLKEIGSQALQDITDRIDRAYHLFYRNLKAKIKTAPPSLKKIAKYKSFTLKQTGWKIINENTIVINKQHYHYFNSRPIEGTIKNITIKRDTLGDIYIYFICQTQENKVLVRTGKSVGFDFGLKKFLTSSESINEDITSPLFFKTNAKTIKNACKQLSRKKKGSHNRRKARLALARLYKRVFNQRKDFHWKLAYTLVSKYATICIEDLNLKGMSKRYGKKISDLGFSDFVKILKYTAKKVGTTIIKVDRYYPSSQLCHCCGYQNKETKDLRIRNWTCPVCHAEHDRDRNAAINIKLKGLKQFQLD